MSLKFSNAFDIQKPDSNQSLTTKKFLDHLKDQEDWSDTEWLEDDFFNEKNEKDI